MKLLVGVMYCIENEYIQCLDAIRNQTHKDFDLFVIEKLPNQEAHQKLYARFMREKDSYDLFVKIDADMVLTRPTFFAEVVETFSQYPETDDLEIGVHDFFTDEMVFGLHIYSPRVIWSENNERIFVDRTQCLTNHLHDKTKLAPAAWHCPDPSLFQSFHFGVHKAVKVMQLGADSKKLAPAISHWRNIVRTREHFMRNPDNRLGMVLVGAETAFRNRFSFHQVDFDNADLLKWFRISEHLSVNEMERFLHKKSLRAFTLFHPDIRYLLLHRVQGQQFRFLKEYLRALWLAGRPENWLNRASMPRWIKLVGRIVNLFSRFKLKIL